MIPIGRLPVSIKQQPVSVTIIIQTLSHWVYLRHVERERNKLCGVGQTRVSEYTLRFSIHQRETTCSKLSGAVECAYAVCFWYFNILKNILSYRLI